MRNTLVREDMHDVILDAAERLLERYGYRKTTMDDLAREAGIGKGTIYLYFPSKEEVALSVVDRINCRLHARLRAIARGAGSTRARLEEMLVTRVLFRYDSVHGYSESLEEMFADIRQALRERRERLAATEAGIFAEVLDEGQSGGTFTFDDAALTAQSLLLATNGLMPLSLCPRELGERSHVEAKALRVADLLLMGLLDRRYEARATAGRRAGDRSE